MRKLLWLVGLGAFGFLIYIFFIPAFAGQISINPVLSIGGFALRWYGLILASSILLAYFVVRKHAWKFGISVRDIDDYSFWVVIVSVLGARAYYVLFSLDYFLQDPSEIYKIWHGGLSIYGGVLAGIVFTYFYCRKKAYSFWQLADLIALGLPLGQALGRFGNFVNQEAYGYPTNLPWKMYIDPTYRSRDILGYDFFHPAFAYEALGSVLVFMLLYRFLGKLKPGGLFLLYLFSYSLVRFFVEGIRVDSFFASGFRVDQLIAFVLVIGSGIWFYLRQMHKH